MLDRDLAELYGVEVKQLKRQVKRNQDRFPADFMFELSREEYNALRSQFGTFKRGKHSKYLPYAFTEQGVSMLSSVLRSTRAVQVNIEIMRAFVRLRDTARVEEAQDWISGQGTSSAVREKVDRSFPHFRNCENVEVLVGAIILTF